ncbi:MAG: SGNH/GDSL hydrolase family protein, partial [Chloroflexota bacterium]
MKQDSKLPRFAKLIILLIPNLIILLILVYGFEFYLGLVDPKKQIVNPLEETNQYGFREEEFAIPKPPETCRIMVIGDSFTWGKAVWVEERYTSQLQLLLHEKYPQIELLNFGFPGAPTTRERNSLREYKDIVEPDLVLVGFVLNDPQTNRQNYSIEREQFEQGTGQTIERFLERVEAWRLEHTAELARQAVDSFAIQAGVIPSWQVALQRTYEKDSKDWQDFEQALRDIKSMSDEMGLPRPILAVLNQGTYTDRPTNYHEPDEELQLYLRWYHQVEETGALLPARRRPCRGPPTSGRSAPGGRR